MKTIIRELCKAFMVVSSLAFPVALAIVNKSGLYLLWLIASYILIVGIFNHYENLEINDRFADNINKDRDE